MELELNRDHISCFDMVLDTAVYQEETLEAIVPDACPDILRIIDAGGQVCLTGKNVREGTVAIAGMVNAWILYQPEDGQGLRRMEVKLPFNLQTEADGLHSQGQVVAMPCLRSVDARALNPRKVLLRADLGVDIQAFQPTELVLCQGVECQEEAGVQQLVVDQTAFLAVAVNEKEFSFTDELRLSAGPGGEAELLGVRAAAWCAEAKVIGNKLIFKGEAEIQVLYRVQEELCSVRYPLPFSQVMEVSNVGESSSCEMQVCVTGIECSVTGEDRRTLSVSLDLLGQGVIREEYPVTLLQDVYSTGWEMVTEQDTYTFQQLMEQSVRPQSVRELVEIPALVKTVVDAAVAVVEVRQGREEDQLAANALFRLAVLYLDEQDTLQSMTQTIQVPARFDLSAQSRCRCRCTCPGEVFAAPAAGGIEVRFTPEFHLMITAEVRVAAISNARLGEQRSTQEGEHPSVVLRLAAPGERLWDIAKAYATTQEQILQANQLEEGELPTGQMLLIPHCR